MTHHLQTIDITSSPQPSIALLETGPTTARVIEVGGTTAGIAVPEHGGVRFFSSQRSFDRFDGALFRSVEQAARTIRERGRRPSGTARRSGPRPIAAYRDGTHSRPRELVAAE